MSRRTEKGERRICTYCGKERTLTREHVIPRGFFLDDQPKPRTPVIVAACDECNKTKSGDDSYMRDFICYRPVCNGHPAVEVLRRTKIASSIRKRRSEMFKMLLKRGLYLPRRSEDGRDLGYHLTVPVHAARINRWCQMLARGLYFAQINKRLPDHYAFSYVEIKESERQAVYDHFRSLGATTYGMVLPDEGLENIVGWCFLVDSRDAHTACWLVWFYMRYLLMITSRPPSLELPSKTWMP